MERFAFSLAPRRQSNYSIQGIRELHEKALGKREDQFTIEIETKKPRIVHNDYYGELEKSLLMCCEDVFRLDYDEWWSKYAKTCLKVRELFLYQRDISSLWSGVEAIIIEAVINITKEFHGLELGAIVPTFLAIDSAMGFKLGQLNNFLYWFNRHTTEIAGKNVKAYLKSLFQQNFIADEQVMFGVHTALVSVYKTVPNPIKTVCDRFDNLNKRKLLEHLMDSVVEFEQQSLDWSSLGAWLDSFEYWKAEQYIFWQQCIAEDTELVYYIVGLLVKFMLGKSIHHYDFASLIFASKVDFERYVQLIICQDTLLPSFIEKCQATLTNFGSMVKALQVRSEVKGRLLCSFGALAINMDHTEFSAHWTKYLGENVEFAPAFAEAVAHDVFLGSDKFGLLGNPICETLELMKDPLDNEPVPFAQSFADNLWKYMAEYSWSPHSTKEDGSGSADDFAEALAMVDAAHSGLAWKAHGFLTQLRKGNNFSRYYWPQPVVPIKSMNIEAEQYEPKFRTLTFDAVNSWCKVAINERSEDVTYLEYKTLKRLPLQVSQVPTKMLKKLSARRLVYSKDAMVYLW